MRYIVVPPVQGTIGYPYWKVADTRNPEMPNFNVAEFWDALPEAEQTARDYAARLNQR